MADLHLNLCGVYFDQIASGEKVFEFRDAAKWSKRLQGKSFDQVLVKRGYPRKDDVSRILVRPWRGYEMQTITHPHFGPNPIEVCAIRVN